MKFLVFLALTLGTHVLSASDHAWSYGEQNGPDQWPYLELGAENQCGGFSQSPIDIKSKKLKLQIPMLPLRFKDSSRVTSRITLVNNGHSLQLNSPDWTQVLTGNPLKSSYKLLQIHCHWGENDSRGSEHTINGKSYALESHMVHTKLPDPDHPTSSAIAVVATFFEATRGESSTGIRKFAQAIKKNMKANEVVDIESELSPSMFLPNKREFYYYEGSLTTPPCTQNVTWIVMKKPLKISKTDLERFRSALFEDGTPMVDNFRPTQPLNNREVKTSVASAATRSVWSLLLTMLPAMVTKA